ncbi:MAG: hypothetical protein GX053_00370 [Tissierella sp.]|nr:hypothetical protein [Tissierella sp.]
MKKQFIIILITYLVASLIRGFTGVLFNPFFDKFDLMLFIKDIMIWTLSYIIVSLIVSKLTKQKSS